MPLHQFYFTVEFIFSWYKSGYFFFTECLHPDPNKHTCFISTHITLQIIVSFKTCLQHALKSSYLSFHFNPGLVFLKVSSRGKTLKQLSFDLDFKTLKVHLCFVFQKEKHWANEMQINNTFLSYRVQGLRVQSSHSRN